MKNLFFALALIGAATSAQATTVFSSDFESGMPSQITPGTALIENVQGYAGLGVSANQFGGNFLRSATGNIVTLSLSSLPPHTSISLDFLFAAIDSLDGTGTFPSGDFFKVTIDGNPIFRESFANAVSSQIQSYLPPAGVELARRIDLGFKGPGGFFTDSAYYLGADPIFQNIPHTASSALITFVIEGNGIQSLDDESWAIENLRVSVAPKPVATSGCVRLNGLPMNNRTVSAKQSGETTRIAKTNTRGCYSFAELTTGKEFSIVVSGPNLLTTQNTSGCLKFNGLPMNNRTVSAKQTNVITKTTKTNAQGCYSFTGLVPGKAFNIVISGPKVPVPQ